MVISAGNGKNKRDKNDKMFDILPMGWYIIL